VVRSSATPHAIASQTACVKPAKMPALYRYSVILVWQPLSAIKQTTQP
jgi:hypothetical protein